MYALNARIQLEAENRPLTFQRRIWPQKRSDFGGDLPLSDQL